MTQGDQASTKITYNTVSYLLSSTWQIRIKLPNSNSANCSKSSFQHPSLLSIAAMTPALRLLLIVVLFWADAVITDGSDGPNLPWWTNSILSKASAYFSCCCSLRAFPASAGAPKRPFSSFLPLRNPTTDILPANAEAAYLPPPLTRRPFLLPPSASSTPRSGFPPFFLSEGPYVDLPPPAIIGATARSRRCPSRLQFPPSRKHSPPAAFSPFPLIPRWLLPPSSPPYSMLITTIFKTTYHRVTISKLCHFPSAPLPRPLNTYRSPRVDLAPSCFNPDFPQSNSIKVVSIHLSASSFPRWSSTPVDCHFGVFPL